jgi:hypothetical protein
LQNYILVARLSNEVLGTFKYSNSAKLKKSRKSWMCEKLDVVRLKDFRIVG